MNNERPKSDREQGFAEASEKKQVGLLAELWAFLRENKKWWLAPILVVLLLVGVLIVLGGTALAPLIYPFF